MERARLESIDVTQENIEKIGTLFPNCITETEDENGQLKKAINFDILRQMLSRDIVEGKKEAYEFNWPGKRASIVTANTPITKTLRPCPKESVNWDTTENLYIEGDNLDVLKLLQKSYLGKVKMIYIDPPYNTGNDYIYHNNLKMSNEKYENEKERYDEEGNCFFKNDKSRGRFHSDWCSMMYSRLVLARNLLNNEGVIFISIDDNELDNISKICNEIFGENNFICKFIWRSKLGKVGTTSIIATTHEYIVCYGKNYKNVTFEMIKNESKERKENLRQWGVADRREDRPSMYYPITINNTEVYPIREDGSDGRWRVGKEKAEQLMKEEHLELNYKNGRFNIYRKFPNEISYTPYETSVYKTILEDNIGTTAKGAKMLRFLEMAKSFNFSKPVELIRHLELLCTKDNDLILDFFSGSSTTAHAVMQLNVEDDGNRKFIMIQLPENCNEKSEAYQMGYKNICEIGKERIRRAGAKIKEEHPEATDLDIGFRVFKVDSSNMEDVYFTAQEYSKDILDKLENNIKADRTDLDLLFGCLLEWQLPLSMPYTTEEIEGYTIYDCNDGDLIVCFEENIPESIIKKIAKKQPLRAVFRDSSFKDSPAKITACELFGMLSSHTEIKVI